MSAAVAQQSMKPGVAQSSPSWRRALVGFTGMRKTPSPQGVTVARRIRRRSGAPQLSHGSRLGLYLDSSRATAGEWRSAEVCGRLNALMTSTNCCRPDTARLELTARWCPPSRISAPPVMTSVTASTAPAARPPMIPPWPNGRRDGRLSARRRAASTSSRSSTRLGRHSSPPASIFVLIARTPRLTRLRTTLGEQPSSSAIPAYDRPSRTRAYRVALVGGHSFEKLQRRSCRKLLDPLDPLICQHDRGHPKRPPDLVLRAPAALSLVQFVPRHPIQPPTGRLRP